jgi:hypothetical protein
LVETPTDRLAILGEHGEVVGVEPEVLDEGGPHFRVRRGLPDLPFGYRRGRHAGSLSEQ